MRFRYDPHPDRLVVVADGPYDGAVAREAVIRIQALCESQRLKKVLVDSRAVETLVSIADRYDLASHVAEQMPGVRVAVLVTPEQHAFTRTFEDTAVNRGARVKTTASPAEALAFLDESAPTQAQ